MSKSKRYISYKVSNLSSFYPGGLIKIREDFISENHLEKLQDSYVQILSKPMSISIGKPPGIRVRFLSIDSDLWIYTDVVRIEKTEK